jgi:ketosteroid isomerase-like protein
MSDRADRSTRNKQTVLDFWQAPATKQPDFLTDDVKWHLPPSIGDGQFGTTTLEGDEAKAIFELATGVYEPTGSMDILHLTAEDDRVALHCVLHTRTRAGYDYDGPYHMLFRIEGDKIAEAWEFLDTAYLAARVVPPGG